MSFKIAVLQFEPKRKNVAENIHKIKALLSGITTDLIVLPELANSGYLYKTPEKLLPFAELNDGSGQYLSSLINLSGITDGIIISGYAEVDGNQLYNSAISVSPDGVIQNYRKIHLYSTEKQLFQPGNNTFKVIDWKGVKIGMMVCFDWIFPESSRCLALAGAQIIAHPSNLVMPYCQNAMITRSIENRVFTVTANRIGREKINQTILQFTGKSQITNPSGNILYRGPKNKETVHVVSINPDDALDKNISPMNDLYKDRRTDLYTIK